MCTPIITAEGLKSEEGAKRGGCFRFFTLARCRVKCSTTQKKEGYSEIAAVRQLGEEGEAEIPPGEQHHQALRVREKKRVYKPEKGGCFQESI